MKKKGFRKLEKSYQKRGFGPGVRLGQSMLGDIYFAKLEEYKAKCF